MSSPRPRAKPALRVLAVLIGVSLLAFLIQRAGPAKLLENARTIGWGMLGIIALAGVSHILKTWAWRLVLLDEAKKVSFWCTLSLRLISEAIGQLGFVGLVFGESARVALLGPEVQISTAISSVTLDRGLFIATGALVLVTGILVATVGVVITGTLRLYALFFVLTLLCLLVFAVQTIHRGWPLFSGTARAAARVPWLRNWLIGKTAVIE